MYQLYLYTMSMYKINIYLIRLHHISYIRRIMNILLYVDFFYIVLTYCMPVIYILFHKLRT